MMSDTDSSVDSKPDDNQRETNTDFGKRLAETRKTRNFSVDEISQHLKIPAWMIIALEANDKEKLPAPTFTRGYIRAYAKFLGISADDVLSIYNRAVPHDVSKLKPRSRLPGEANSQSPLMKTITILLVIAVISIMVFGGFQYYQKKADVLESEFDTKQQNFSGNSLNSPGRYSVVIKKNAQIPDDELVSGKVDAYVPAAEEAEVTETTAGRAENAATQTAAVTSNRGEVQAIQPEARKTETTNANSHDTIEIIAEKGSWVEVRDANKSRLLYNMLPVGGSRELVGRAPFSVTMGNAKTTHVLVNGIEVDTSDYIRSSNTANFKVSTQGQDVIFH